MGKRIQLSNGRRLVVDVIEMARRMPTAGLSGDYDVSLVNQFRRLTRPKIAWNILYMKAYAAVGVKTPALRQSYCGFPWEGLYEHDTNVCMMTIARSYAGAERLFFARFNRPDEQTLSELQALYDHYRFDPIDEIKQFRHQIKFAKSPRWLRRFAWWTLFNVWPSKRASHMGTFGMSFSGYKGAYGDKHLGPNTTTLGVDPLPRQGIARTLLTFDHRVMDGTPATQILTDVHKMLNTAIRTELAAMANVDPETGQPLDRPTALASQTSSSLKAA